MEEFKMKTMKLIYKTALLGFGLPVMLIMMLQSGCSGPKPVESISGDGGISAGYPRPVSFRQESPAMLEADQDKIQMVVSDHGVWTRQYGHEAFAKKFPEKPVLIHVGGDFISANAYSPLQMVKDRGLYEGDVRDRYLATRSGYEEILNEDFLPMPGFLGYWVYEAGVNALDEIPAGQHVTIRVPSIKGFEPRQVMPGAHRGPLIQLNGNDRVSRIVVVCPRNDQGELDWMHAELAEVAGINSKEGSVTLRRFHNGEGFPPLPAGSYIAASAPIWDRIVDWGRRNLSESHPFHDPVWQFFMPNFSPLCPVDPETGLNAAQWFARHFVERKKKYYPNSGGYALDVCTDTHFPKPHHVAFADIDNDGVVDRGFIDGVSWWALGMHDFVYYMREGVPGIFEGMGDDLLVTWDASDNNDQRLFHLLNGAEFEHTMIHGIPWGAMQHKFSGNLDRLLLWGERAQKPNITFVSNKNPDDVYHGGTKEDFRKAQEARPVFALHHKRLDMASACMTTGYFHSTASRGNPSFLNDYPGKSEQRSKYGAPLLQDYDEFHQGTDSINNWLGLPLQAPQRYRDHLGPVVYAFSHQMPLPRIVSADPLWKASEPIRKGRSGFVLHVDQIGPYISSGQSFTLTAQLPLNGLELEELAEYAVTFDIRGASPYKDVSPRYRPIPKNIHLRLRVGDTLIPASAPPSYKAAGKGYYQECMVFEETRRVHLTIQAPASGEGLLEVCISEVPGTIEISNLEIRKGCADVLYREFENGLVILNGSSTTDVDIDIGSLFPGKRFERLNGTQDPVHNDGSLAERILLGRRDGIFLKRHQ
jgi:hypothetical protein